jgi:hypothetical protein
MRKRCDNCAYWQTTTPVKALSDGSTLFHYGNCRRHSPHVTTEHHQSLSNSVTKTRTQWPETKEHDMCGDWQAIT